MTRITFYLGADESARARHLLACRIAEKAWRTGHEVYIHTASPDVTSEMDELLWTFRDGAFVPHVLAGTDDDPARVVIGHDPEQPGSREHDVAINLSDEVPVFFGRFHRLAEVVAGDPEQRRLARERYRFYRDRGYSLETHELG